MAIETAAPEPLRLPALLALSKAHRVTMGSALDAVAAERFIARVGAVQDLSHPVLLTGWHLLPLASQRAELLPAFGLRFVSGSENALASMHAIESACRTDVDDGCKFEMSRVFVQARAAELGLHGLRAEIRATVVESPAHLEVALDVTQASASPAESRLYPSIQPGVRACRVQCLSVSAYTAQLMTAISATTGLDIDAGREFQLAYLVRHYWARLPAIEGQQLDWLRKSLTHYSGIPVADSADSHRLVWAEAMTSARNSKRWAEFVDLRSLRALLDSGSDDRTVRTSRDVNLPPPKSRSSDWSTVSAEIIRFLYQLA